MAYVPGVDTALLAKVNLDTEAAWSPNQAGIENQQVEAETLKIMLSKQKPMESVLLEKLTDTSKDYDIKVNWPDFCGLEAQDCAADLCGNDIAADMAPVKELPYKIQQCIEDKFAIEENKLVTSSIDPAKFLLQNQNAIIKRMLEKWNAKHVAFLNANVGYNAGKVYAANAGFTQIPTADYSMYLMPKIMQDMVYSRIPNAFLVDGGAMQLAYTNARLNAKNAEGAGDFARTQLLDSNFDLLGFGKANLSDTSFLVAPYSYASVTKNYVKNSAPMFDEALGTRGLWKYTISIPAFGIVIDVFHQRVCADAAKQRYTLRWLYKLHYDLFLNPTGCDQGGGNIVSGIIGYKKTDNPV